MIGMTWGTIDVRRIVAMALRTVSLACNAGCGIAPPHILQMSDGFDMTRPYAGALAAEVVGLQPFRDSGDQSLISQAVG